MGKREVKSAYFCAEFGIEGLPFGGGLGILSGDFIKSGADLGYNVIGVGYLYRRRFHQKLHPDGWQEDTQSVFDPTGKLDYKPTDVTIPVNSKQVRLGAWELPIIGETGHVVPLYLVDPNGNNDSSQSDEVCSFLYPSSQQPYDRLAQEQVLGTGGVRILKALGHGDIDVCHMNEGHVALAGLETLREYGSLEEARRHLVFTTHTPVPAGIDHFPRDLAELVLRECLPSLGYMKELTGADELNMARLAMSLSGQAFGVSPLHAAVSRYKFSDFPNMYRLYSIDNGVHLQTWVSPEVSELYDQLTHKQWRLHPETLERILELSDEQVINAHNASRDKLGYFLQNNPRAKNQGATYDPNKLTIGFARRFATYKQATLIFEQIDRLRRLGNDIQIVFAGKAHPSDVPGKEVIKEVFRYMKELQGQVSIWFIEDYDRKVAKYMVRGADVWLNNPERLLEASGTSGMKAAPNFVPQLSILDGWSVPQEPAKGYRLPKGLIEGVTGWSIGRAPTQEDFMLLNGDHHAHLKRQEDRAEDAASLYSKLEHLADFRKDRKAFAQVMKRAAAHNAPWFNTHRVARQYLEVYNALLEDRIAA